jgi:hypothetical protein
VDVAVKWNLREIHRIATMSCKYLLLLKRGEVSRACLLGWYGGAPTEDNCNQCILAGKNTTKAMRDAQRKAKLAHPADRPRLSGCCDRADQA